MARARPLPQFDAIVLAGGRGSRLGGTDKPGLAVGPTTIVASVVRAAIGAGAHRVVVVGPTRPELLAIRPGPPGGLAMVRENPPVAGPVPAVRCGLASARSSWAAVLAADLPFLRARHLHELLAAAARGKPAAGAVLVDEAGRSQWLAGCWQTRALRFAADAYAGASLHGLLLPLGPVQVSADISDGEPPPWFDCDTAGDLDVARHWQDAQAPRQPTKGTTMNTLQSWTEAACAELGIDPAAADARTILDLARDVAHQVERPAAPLTAFLLGLAVGMGQPLDASAERLRQLAMRWAQAQG
jgi:molybdopterin-guanine dinucleotide biosynthesis protein A